MNDLKNQRKKLGHTQKWVAEKVGISEQAYQMYEYDKREPGVRLANKLADTLKTTTKKLWTD